MAFVTAPSGNGYPLPTTPSDIISLALKTANVLGVGQAAQPEDVQDAFMIMNMMMAQWQRRRYMVYQLIDVSLQATGQQKYTVGPGGDFNIVRPAKLESAFFRQTPVPNGYSVDYPFTILRSWEDYARISVKQLTAFPQYIFMDGGYPLQNLYIWPIPSNLYEIHLVIMQQLQKFQTISDVIVMPDEYKAALMYNLALRLYPLYGLPVNDVVAKQAESSMRIIEEINTQLPRLVMPSVFQGKNATYNIYGDYPVGGNV